jgi:hypothetical protein
MLKVKNSYVQKYTIAKASIKSWHSSSYSAGIFKALAELMIWDKFSNS